MSPAALVVSPHLDDAMLSAFALVAAGADVMTVFAGEPNPPQVTDWDRECGFANSSEAMAQRRAEESNAFAGLDARRVELDLLDEQYRNAPLTEADQRILHDAVSKWTATAGPSPVIAMPAGAGRALTTIDKIRYRIPHRRLGLPGGSPPHPDHLAVTDLLVRSLADQARAGRVTLALYEDLPYAYVAAADRRVAELAAHHALRATEQRARVDVAAKSARVAAYASQVRGAFAGWVRAVEDVLPEVERSWLLSAH